MGKGVFIVFTGGCFSGKTTTMYKFKEIFEKELDIPCVFLKEVIRDFPGSENISKLREDQDAYLDMQLYTTKQRQDNLLESHYDNKDKNTVVLIDRGMADCMFYSTYYLKRENVSKERDIDYTILLNYIESCAEFNIQNIYDYILEFTPIETNADKEQQKFRPDDIDSIKWKEHELINKWNKLFNEKYNFQGHYSLINLNNMTEEELTEWIKNIGKNIKDEYFI